MIITNKESLKGFSFIDFVVVDFIFDKSRRILKIGLSGALYKYDGNIIELGRGYFMINQYKSIHTTSYNAINNFEKVLSEDELKPLREVSEIEMLDSAIIVKGYSEVDNDWIELEISGGEVRGEFDDLSDRGKHS